MTSAPLTIRNGWSKKYWPTNGTEINCYSRSTGTWVTPHGSLWNRVRHYRPWMNISTFRESKTSRACLAEILQMRREVRGRAALINIPRSGNKWPHHANRRDSKRK
jgi:hypothetical protein